ncbi:MAG: hypothetical protein WCO09_05215 [bacterium]
MVDLGLFNFIKNATVQGKSKEEILNTLSSSDFKQSDIDQAYLDVQNNNIPVVNKIEVHSPAAVVISSHADSRPTVITALCGYYFISWTLQLMYMLVLAASLSQNSKVNFGTSLGINSLPSFIFTIAIAISMFGYWGMKKWGVHLFTVTELVSLVYIFSNLHGFNLSVMVSLIVSLLLPIFVIYNGYKYLDLMF